MNKIFKSLIIFSSLITLFGCGVSPKEEARNNLRKICKAVYENITEARNNKTEVNVADIQVSYIYCNKDKLKDER